MRFFLPIFLLALAGSVILPANLLAASGNEQAEKNWYWVFFDRRDTSPEARAKILASLDEKAKARRIRAMGQVLLESDLPVHPDDISLLKSMGLTIRSQSRWLAAVSVEVNRQQLSTLQRLPHVLKAIPVRKGKPKPAASIEYEFHDELDEIDSLEYGGAWTQDHLAGLPAAHDMGYRGEGIRIGFLDSGYNNVFDHHAFDDLEIIETWNVIDQTDFVETHNHGGKVLAVACAHDPGQMIGAAPDAEVLLVRTEDAADEYPAEEDYWVAGLEWAEAHGADLISTSLGYYEWYEFDDFDGNTAVTTIAADLAAARGLLVVTSAGNRGVIGVGAPADGDSVLTVGAVDSAGEVAAFSSRGPTADGRIKPDVMTMGSMVTTMNDTTVDQYFQRSGTSYSCPIAAGATAILLQANPDLLPMDIIEAFRSTATQSDAPDNDYGWGLIDLPAAIRLVRERTTLTIPLAANYFELVSFPVLPDDLDAETIFGNIPGLRIVYQNDGGIFLPPDLNTIGSINPREGYRIFTDTASTLEIEGQLISETMEYTLEAGRWNWLGYPFSYPSDTEQVLSSIEDIVVILMNDSGNLWIPGQLNTLNQLVPGEGYLAYVSEDRTFTFQPADPGAGTFRYGTDH